MSDRNLTIVIGAGASKEAELPIGRELIPKITNLLNIKFNGYSQSSGDYTLNEAIKIHCESNKINDISEFIYTAWRIVEGLPLAISIDNYINAHRGNEKLELCGKLAIVRSILDAERKSSIYQIKGHEYTINHAKLTNTWYPKFFQIITENCHIQDIKAQFKRIKIISFNYDRCIEHYLYLSLQTYYGIDSKESGELMKHLEVHHPYGSVGSFDWQDNELKACFGEEATAEKLLDLASRIRTFTEGIDPKQSNIVQIREIIQNSERILFLGFSYLNQNMDLLGFSERYKGIKSPHYYGTAKGLSTSDSLQIENNIKKFLGSRFVNPDVNINNYLTCSEILQEYSRGLSLA